MLSYRGLLGILTAIVVSFAGCASKQVLTAQDTTIAVWDLENLTPGDPGMLDLGEPLSTKIIDSLKESGDFTVIERQRLLLALEELNIGSTSLVDEDTRLSMGKMLGARFMVFGGYQVIADTFRIDLRLVEVETGRILEASQKTTSGSNLSTWLKTAEEAAADLF
jgi:curli biogenesis system outer membrane secretion channel CsgG